MKSVQESRRNRLDDINIAKLRLNDLNAIEYDGNDLLTEIQRYTKRSGHSSRTISNCQADLDSCRLERYFPCLAVLMSWK